MKKSVCGLTAALLLSFAGVAAQGAVVASDAAVTAPAVSGDYGPTKADAQATVAKVKDLLSGDNLSPKKVAKLIDKLSNLRDAGLISQSQYKKLKKKLKASL